MKTQSVVVLVFMWVCIAVVCYMGIVSSPLFGLIISVIGIIAGGVTTTVVSEADNKSE